MCSADDQARRVCLCVCVEDLRYIDLGHGAVVVLQTSRVGREVTRSSVDDSVKPRCFLDDQTSGFLMSLENPCRPSIAQRWRCRPVAV